VAFFKTCSYQFTQAEIGLIQSIDFIKELCEIAKETLQAEKQTAPEEEQKSGKAAGEVLC